MEVIILPSIEAVAKIAADAIERLIASTEDPVLGLATGSTPVPTYQDLIQRHRQSGLSFRSVRAFLLDEYVGLAPDHPASYRNFISREFAEPTDLNPANLHGPQCHGTGEEVAQAAIDYDAAISKAGGIDLQILGIGTDGHIGFNEPMSSLSSRTRLKSLTVQTRQDNARFFEGNIDAVPGHVVTQGIGTILEARHILLVATGPSKASPIARAIEGPLAAMIPASALQWHPHVTVLLDESAAAKLTHTDYYRETYQSKPSWQHI